MNADNNSYEQWLAEGGLSAAERASKRWKALLENYQQPLLDPAVDEAMEDYIARRKAEEPDRAYA